MFKKLFLSFLWVFFLKGACFGMLLWETENSVAILNIYSRNDIVTFKNVVDLDSRNKDDHATYFGIDYSISSLLEFKEGGPKYYLMLERNGPGDYDAPIFIHNTLMTTNGPVKRYRNAELLPNVEEVWLDTPLRHNLGFKIGLYTYEVGEGLALNGAYENYGATLYKKFQNSTLRLYYCRPDSFYKVRLGPRIRQDELQDYRYETNASNFFSADLRYDWDNNYMNPYVGVLSDYTSRGKRDNLFSAPVSRDILGTLGWAFRINREKLSFALETAHNFGQAKSASSDYKDIYHTGYMVYTDTSYSMGKVTPFFKFLFASGNKVTPEIAENEDTTLTSGKNRAFSSYSPLNMNLDDSIGSWHCAIRPLVFMGSCYALNNGVPRPGTFASSDFDNLIILAPGFDWKVTKKLEMSLDFFYLQSVERGVGVSDGKGRYLPRELGYEVNLTADYQINKNVLLSVAGGYFFPGRYYKAAREDTAGSLFSPFMRGDGKANRAYLVETSIEFNF